MRALIASDDLANPVAFRLGEFLRNKGAGQSPVAATFEEIESCLTQVQPELLVVVLSPDPERGLQALRLARGAVSGPALAVGQASEPKLILRALNEGADHYLDEADFESAFEGVLARLRSKAKCAEPLGELIGVLGASGGSGTSTLAVNIAAVLAKEHGNCTLLDLKPGQGDLAYLLDLKPRFSLVDVCLNVARLDRGMLEKALAQHDSGIHLLASPPRYEDTRLLISEAIDQVLGLARQVFPRVVMDLEDCFHPGQVVALRQASVILLVSRLDFTSLRKVRHTLEHLNGLGVTREQVRLVINRYGQPNELPAQEAEDALGGRTACYIPDDPKTINGANNTGIPAVLKAPDTKVSQAIAQLARTALNRPKEKPTLLSRLFAR